MRSSADRTLTAAADRIVAATGVARRPLVLIDGRSGSGKTTLAALVAQRWGDGAQIVALDDLYPGWDGLAAGAERAREDVLDPFSRAEAAAWRRWDWTSRAPAETHRVDPDRPLIVEGVGVLTPATAPLADVRVWLACATEVRRQRALERDGEAYRPFWDTWAAQEEVHLAEHTPAALATHTFTIA